MHEKRIETPGLGKKKKYRERESECFNVEKMLLDITSTMWKRTVYTIAINIMQNPDCIRVCEPKSLTTTLNMYIAFLFGLL